MAPLPAVSRPLGLSAPVVHAGRQGPPRAAGRRQAVHQRAAVRVPPAPLPPPLLLCLLPLTLTQRWMCGGMGNECMSANGKSDCAALDVQLVPSVDPIYAGDAQTLPRCGCTSFRRTRTRWTSRRRSLSSGSMPPRGSSTSCELVRSPGASGRRQVATGSGWHCAAALALAGS